MEIHRRTIRFARPAIPRWTPLGFGLENFDAIGQYRTAEGKFPIDSVEDTQPDGRPFKSAVEQ